MKAINEVGHVYGPWKVVRRIDPPRGHRDEYHKYAWFELRCTRCGEKYEKTGDQLRFGKYKKVCEKCGAGKYD